ncbi:MAG: phage portal protein, partial [Colwellia sp.]|nr:phage portal protein [Colwellia sp.]
LDFDQKAICNVLGWETKLLNSDEGAKYDNYKLATKIALSKSIIPHNSLWEEAFNTEFLPRFKGYEGAILEFEYDELPEMQPDMKMLTDWLLPLQDRGTISRDETRDATNFPMLETEEMQTHTVSMNTIPLEEAILGSDFDGNLEIDES